MVIISGVPIFRIFTVLVNGKKVFLEKQFLLLRVDPVGWGGGGGCGGAG